MSVSQPEVVPARDAEASRKAETMEELDYGADYDDPHMDEWIEEEGAWKVCEQGCEQVHFHYYGEEE